MRHAVSTGQHPDAVATHGKLLSLSLRWVRADVGYDVWSQLSNPDVYVIQARWRRYAGVPPRLGLSG